MKIRIYTHRLKYDDLVWAVYIPKRSKIEHFLYFKNALAYANAYIKECQKNA